jgi:hypothetical protein
VVSIMMTTMKLYYLYQSMIWQYTWGSVNQHLDILFGQVSKYQSRLLVPFDIYGYNFSLPPVWCCWSWIMDCRPGTQHGTTPKAPSRWGSPPANDGRLAADANRRWRQHLQAAPARPSGRRRRRTGGVRVRGWQP